MLSSSRPMHCCNLNSPRSSLLADYREQSWSTTRTWVRLLSVAVHGPHYKSPGQNDRLFWTLTRRGRQQPGRPRHADEIEELVVCNGGGKQPAWGSKSPGFNGTQFSDHTRSHDPDTRGVRSY